MFKFYKISTFDRKPLKKVEKMLKIVFFSFLNLILCHVRHNYLFYHLRESDIMTFIYICDLKSYLNNETTAFNKIL